MKTAILVGALVLFCADAAAQSKSLEEQSKDIRFVIEAWKNEIAIYTKEINLRRQALAELRKIPTYADNARDVERIKNKINDQRVPRAGLSYAIGNLFGATKEVAEALNDLKEQAKLIDRMNSEIPSIYEEKIRKTKEKLEQAHFNVNFAKEAIKAQEKQLVELERQLTMNVFGTAVTVTNYDAKRTEALTKISQYQAEHPSEVSPSDPRKEINQTTIATPSSRAPPTSLPGEQKPTIGIPQKERGYNIDIDQPFDYKPHPIQKN